MTTFAAAKDGYLYEGKTVEFSDLWTRDGLNLVLLDGEWAVQIWGYEDFQPESFELLGGFHPDFAGFVCLEEEGEHNDFDWFLKSEGLCDHRMNGTTCLEPATWTCEVQLETSPVYHYCGTHASEYLRTAKVGRAMYT